MNDESIEAKTRACIEAIENVDPSPADTPAETSALIPAGTMPAERFTAWAKRVLAGNPAYILSAGLLLYSISMLSGDAKFLSQETLKLAFNFGALQLYELMLVVTAIFLARREIWYDSTLLVFLENLLVFVPFILVSQAIFIGPGFAWTICLVGGLLAAIRFAGLKRYFRALNFPAPLVGLGMLFLGLHLILPMVLRSVYQEGDPRTSEPVFQAVLTNIWLFAMPVLAALALGLPQPSAGGERAPERRWLPLLFLGVWVGGTGVHLSAIGYVYSIKWEWFLLAPVLWASAWIAYERRADFLRSSQGAFRQILMVLPGISTGFALAQPHRPVFAVLSVLNTVAFTVLWLRERGSRLVLELWIYSLGSAIVGACYWGNAPVFSGGSGMVWPAGLIAFGILQALIFRDPRIGLVGAIGAAMAAAHGAQEWNGSGHWAAQAGLIFFMLHSLSWREPREDGAKSCRVLAAIAWVIDIWVWMADRGGNAAWQGSSMAVLLLAGYGATRWIWGTWGPRIIPAVAAVALASTQGYYAAVLFQTAPAGLIAMAGSFLLFGIGTGMAWTKPRWNREIQAKNRMDMIPVVPSAQSKK